MLDIVKTFLEENCPHLSGRRLSVNFLAENAGALGLSAVSCKPVVRAYADGGALRQFQFMLTARVPFDDDAEDALEPQALIDGITDFLENTSAQGIFPALSKGNIPREFFVIERCAPLSNNTKTARLQATCSLLYETKGC